MGKLKNKFIFLIGCFLFCIFICQPVDAITYTGNGNYYMVERSNLRRYDNGKYSGLVSREVRSFINEENVPQKALSQYIGDTWYSGSFYVIEQTVKSLIPTAVQIDGAVESEFHISSDGKLIVEIDKGYPTFRSFPAFPAGNIAIGEKWRAEAVRAVDPLNKGITTHLPMYVEYTLSGEEVYQGEEVWRIKANWATRYGKTNWDFGGDKELKTAAGSHKADILVLKDTGSPIFITDSVDETFVYANGLSVQFKGTITMFTEFPPAIDYDMLIPALNRIASITVNDNASSVSNASNASSISNESSVLNETNASNEIPSDSRINNSNITALDNGEDKKNLLTTRERVENALAAAGISNSEKTNDNELSSVNSNINGKTSTGAKNNIIVEPTNDGLRLSIQDIKFAADSSEILGSEKSRLDEIAAVLKLADGARFLVVGHTASVGKKSGEKQLSIERAKRIVNELTARGLNAESFLFDGYGGEKPVATNDTEEGRAKNRRVEITILD